jgi:hypothetical protein
MASKPYKQWPENDKPARFQDIVDPIVKAIEFTYKMERKNERKNVPWNGLDIGEHQKVTSLRPRESLSAKQLAYDEEDQGRSALEVIVGLAVQLGAEQGRRCERERLSGHFAWRFMAIDAALMDVSNRIAELRDEFPKEARDGE